jgi:PAS domain S-box-containing protein
LNAVQYRLKNSRYFGFETERMFGYLREELIGRSIEMLVPFNLRDAHLQQRMGFVARPERRRMGAGRDLFGLRKDRSEFPVEIGLNPIHTREGLLILSAVVDITESERAQAALVESAAMARGIVETALDAFVQMDEAGAIVEWNSQAELLFGWSREQAIGKLLVDIIVPEFHRARYKEGLARLSRCGTARMAAASRPKPSMIQRIMPISFVSQLACLHFWAPRHDAL